MKITNKIWLPALIALAALPTIGFAQDLFESYELALRQDPVLSQQLAERHITGEDVPLARSELLPQLSAGLSIQQTNGPQPRSNGLQGNSGGSGHSRNRNKSVNLSQTVFDFSKYADLRAAKAGDEAADATYEAALQNLIIRVSQAYFDVLTANDQVAFTQSLEKQLARQLDQAQARFDAGVSPITDVEDAKAQHDSATAQLIDAKNILDDTREALAEITGEPVENLNVLAEKIPLDPPAPNTLETWVDSALTNNPGVIAGHFNVKSAEQRIKSARAARLPTVEANAEYNRGAQWRHHGPGGHNSNHNTTIGLSLNIPLFQGGAIHSNIKRAIYQRDSADASLTQQLRQVARDTRNHFRSVNAGISQVNATRQAVISAQSSLDATQAGFDVGTRTIVDVLLAQQNLADARQQYSQARHQLILDRLSLKLDSGTLAADDVKAVNALLVSAGSVDPTATPSKQ